MNTSRPEELPPTATGWPFEEHDVLVITPDSAAASMEDGADDELAAGAAAKKSKKLSKAELQEKNWCTIVYW